MPGAFDPNQSVRHARDAYLRDNGLSIDGYTGDHFFVPVGPVTLRFRNYRARRRVIPLHDLHHVVTGYGTDLRGEAEQSAWELSGGINSWFLWWFKLAAIAIGLLLSPRRVARAWRCARGQRTLYVGDHDYQQLLDMSVGELRVLLGVPPEGHRQAS